MLLVDFYAIIASDFLIHQLVIGVSFMGLLIGYKAKFSLGAVKREGI